MHLIGHAKGFDFLKILRAIFFAYMALATFMRFMICYLIQKVAAISNSSLEIEHYKN
ncbi:MAG: hypothetical protein AB1420_11845 [Bacillota bacterium]